MVGPVTPDSGPSKKAGDKQTPPNVLRTGETNNEGLSEKDKALAKAKKIKDAEKGKVKDKAHEQAEHIQQEMKYLVGKITSAIKSYLATLKALGLDVSIPSENTAESRKTLLDNVRRKRKAALKFEKKHPKIVIPEDQRKNLKTEILKDPARLTKLSNAQWIYASIKLQPFDEKLFKAQPLASLFAHLNSPGNKISFNPHTGAEIIKDIDLGNPAKGDIVFLADKATKTVEGKKGGKKKEFRFKQAGILQGVKKVGGKRFLQLAINEGGSIKIKDVDPKDIHGVFHLVRNTTKINAQM